MTSLDVLRAIIAALKSDDPTSLETAARQLDAYVFGQPRVNFTPADTSLYGAPVQRIVLSASEIIVLDAPEVIVPTPIRAE